MFKSSSEKLLVRIAVLQILYETPIGGTVTYAKIHEITGLDAQSARPFIYGAMQRANKERGLLFENERDVGYRRIEQEHAPGLGLKARQSIGRKARRTAVALTRFTLNSNGLEPEVAKKVNREIALAGLIEYSASSKGMRAVEASESAENPRVSTATAGAAILAKLNARDKG
ncbi:hypothetical protein [Ancylobacter amanitiformis]|uniref:Uncharacterized protein n=1 Tax=Ancylobacter amanitiformis TaxID=217069 RepID=A0ABU0LQE0_9HYPH|nr:hypothetical protein [Ancylobacter amanitiformis]MDQ0510911.1 hypothetical protein [Ancylobacter amanitiformis]